MYKDPRALVRELYQLAEEGSYPEDSEESGGDGEESEARQSETQSANASDDGDEDEEADMDRMSLPESFVKEQAERKARQ